MNMALSTVGKYFFNFSVVFYFGYAYFAFGKFMEKLKSEF